MDSGSSLLNRFPDLVIRKILSYLGAEDLVFNIPEFGERWGEVAKDETLWKKITYECDVRSNNDRVYEVRCAIVPLHYQFGSLQHAIFLTLLVPLPFDVLYMAGVVCE
jgi:hypothetical protein